MGLLVNRGESQPLALTSAFRLPFIGAVSDDPKIRRRDDKTRERQQHLVRHTAIQPAPASYHLERLVAGGLLIVIPQGRH